MYGMTGLMGRKKILVGLSAVCLVGFMPAMGRAQVQDDTTVIYDQAYFAQYKAVTLEDMVKKIPGGVSILSDLERLSRNGNRGFGSSGAQFLINGKRMSGKSNDISKRLTRIQAKQVDRIELIRGTAEGLDIRNEGILINVILKEGAASSSTIINLSSHIVREANVLPEFLIAHNGSWDNLDYGISYEYDTWRAVTHVDEDVLDGDRHPVGFRPQTMDKKDQNHVFSGNLKYEFENGDVVQLNGLFNIKDWRKDITEDQFTIDPLGIAEFAQDQMRLTNNKRDNWEIGGDYQGQFGRLGTLKTLFVFSRAIRDDLFSSYDRVGENRLNDLIFKSDYIENEKIFRTSLSTTVGDHTFDYGGEGAFNKLDKTVLSDETPNDSGDDRPARTIVKESRYELFATYSYAARPDLNFQTSLIGEFSKITQDSGLVQSSRSFQFLKPRFEVRYDFSSQDQFRLVAERTVSQLDLNDFVISRNENDDSFNFGNPNLIQEKIWTYTLSYERRFANDSGSVELSLAYEDISDHLDKIEIASDDDVISGIGNVGEAERLTAIAKSNFRFGFIGLPMAVMTVKYTYSDSETSDPFTLEERPVRGTSLHHWSIDFQHDLIEWDMTYGFNIHRRSPLVRQDISLREETKFRRHMSLFAEYKLRQNMKLRLDVEYLLGDVRVYDKTYYTGHIRDNIISQIEVQDQRENRRVMLGLQMSF